MPSVKTEIAVKFVQENMPPGTTIRNVLTRKVYVIGAKYRNTDFWVMSLNPPEKGLLHAQSIKLQFEVVEDANA